MLTAMTAVMLVLLCMAVVVSVPVSYALTIDIRDPFRLTGMLTWGNALCRCSFTYTYGQKPVKKVYWLKKEKIQQPSAEEPVISEAQTEAAAKAAEKEEHAVTYEELKNTSLPDTQRSWKKHLWNADFFHAAAVYASRLLCHSRIRAITLSGTIGLPEPHETGILAGICYALVPDSIHTLHFNFTEEEYNGTVTLRGYIYPVVLAAYTCCFAISRPVRQLIACRRTHKKGEPHHG